MARTFLNEPDRSQLIQRLRQLRSDAAPAWGTLDAPRMLCHLADQMRVALGDVPSKPTHTLVSRTLVKFMVVNTGVEPPRGKIQTAPEMLLSKPSTWEADRSTCIDLVERIGRGEAHAVHPAFGPLSSEEWGRLCWKHSDYHLRQFGS